MNMDNIEIEILDDGTIKITTDKVSGPNHQNAEEFLRFMSRLAGGISMRTKRVEGHQHVHEHNHVHE